MSEYTHGPEQSYKKEVLDEQIFETFKEAASFQAYEQLDGDNKHQNEQRDLFLSGEITNPVLDYPSLDADKIAKSEACLISLKNEIIQNESNETVKQAYRWRINEKIAKTRMLKAAIDGDYRKFTQYSEFIYGKPSPDVFSYTINSIRDEAESDVDADNLDVRLAAQELLASLPTIPRSEFTTIPDSETVNFAKNQTNAN